MAHMDIDTLAYTAQIEWFFCSGAEVQLPQTTA